MFLMKLMCLIPSGFALALFLISALFLVVQAVIDLLSSGLVLFQSASADAEPAVKTINETAAVAMAPVLGCGLIMPEPKPYGSELGHGEVV
jgi:hypothetical protein